MSGPLLSIRSLTVDFGPARVVEDLSLTIAPGEKFGLVGESGSGKTVTALSILQLNQGATYSGRIEWAAAATAATDLLSLDERRLRGVRGGEVAMIFQEPMTALNPLYTIGNQIVESLQLHEGLTSSSASARAIDLLRRTGVPEPERRLASYPHQLSGGQRQRAMIAMALACRPRLLIADEPTTALDVTIQAQILALLNELQQELGMAVLLITHDLNLVRRFADRVGVMQAGRLVETAETGRLFATPQHDYTRQLLGSRPQRSVVPLDGQAPVLLETRRLSCTFPIKRGWFKRDCFVAVDATDLQLRRGETLGIVGESGSGKTTLGMALLGLQAATGEVSFDGNRLDRLQAPALRRLRKRMQVVFQDPFSSLSPRRTVEQIVGEGLELHFPELSTAQRQQRIVEILAEVGLEKSMLGRYPHEFSGGQRQRIAVARVAVLQPDLILLDEPTSALDATVQKQVLGLLSELQRRHGMSFLFITHDLAVIRAVAHRIVVMKDGRIVESGETETVLKQPSQPYTQELLAAALSDEGASSGHGRLNTANPL
jgi:microcin C transport system ATP-binding protein